ncbi:TPA: YihA family ribosome biogenesis GTP-binding protein [bacterium]|jgi:GTP-binding protein|nr:YihA family ribosome biogenesis GTP-binding protein [bacterium]
MALINVKFVLSAPSKEHWPKSDLPECVFLGRSNVGKSSFINFICNNSTIAKVSSSPGHTRYLNFFNVNDQFMLVDSPGYGYHKASKKHDVDFARMMEEYLFERKNLKLAILLLNSHIPLSEDDIMIYDLLKESHIPIMIVATKTDKLNQSKRAKMYKEFKEKLNIDDKEEIYLSSVLNKKYRDKIVNKIISYFTPPL